MTQVLALALQGSKGMLMEIATDSTDKEILTKSRWLQWEKDLTGGTTGRAALDRAYSRLFTSSILREQFLVYPPALQLVVLDSLVAGLATPNQIAVESELRLQLHKMQTSSTESNEAPIDWSTVAIWEIEKFILSKNEDFNILALDALTSRLEDIYDDGEKYQTVSSISVIPWLLAALHGDAVVTEVLTLWTEFPLRDDLKDLVLLVEKWDTVKDCPIQWAIQMAKDTD